MIKSFKDSNTQALFFGQRIPKFINIESVALRKLAMRLMLKLSIITKEENKMRTIPYPSPAEILREEFLNPLAITYSELADAISISQDEAQKIVTGLQPMTAEIDLRLARYFDVSEGFWTGLQEDYNHSIAKDKLHDILPKIKPIQTQQRL